MPGAGCVDHRVRAQGFRACAVPVTNLKPGGLPSPGLEFVQPDTADVRDQALGIDVAGESGPGRERSEVAFDQFCTRRIPIGLGRVPARRCEQARTRAVDMYSQGENSCTWPHWRTECLAVSPASSTTG